MKIRELIEEVLKRAKEGKYEKVSISKTGGVCVFNVEEYVLIDLNPDHNIMLREIKIELSQNEQGKNIQLVLTAKVYCKMQKM